MQTGSPSGILNDGKHEFLLKLLPRPSNCMLIHDIIGSDLSRHVHVTPPRGAQSIDMTDSPSPNAIQPATYPSTPTMSSSQNTPRVISTASNESYLVVMADNDIRVPDSFTYVQTSLYEQPNEQFQGRMDILTSLDASLLPSLPRADLKLPKTRVICGPPGMGKTQTALQYFHTRRGHFDVIMWVQANNVESLHAAFTQIAVRVGLQKVDSPRHQPDQGPKQVLDWLRNPVQETWKSDSRRMKWLLVFDNVNEEKVLWNYWPYNAPGSIIITTRDPITRDTRDSAKGGLTLSGLSEVEAVALLQNRLPEHLWSDEPSSELIRFVRTLACWPLAIVQMAGTMRRLNQTPSRFLNNYQKESKRAKYYEQAESNQDGYPISLSSLWSLSNPESSASRLLSVMSLLLPNSIPDFLLEDTSGKAQLIGYPAADDYDWVVSELEKSFTIYRATSMGTQETNIHSLTQEVIRSQLLKQESRYIEVFNATVRLFVAVWDLQTIPTTRYRELATVRFWEHTDKLLPHLRQLRNMYELLSLHGKQECATEDFLNILNEVGW